MTESASGAGSVLGPVFSCICETPASSLCWMVLDIMQLPGCQVLHVVIMKVTILDTVVFQVPHEDLENAMCFVRAGFVVGVL